MILGGTLCVVRHIAEALLAAGHAVSLLKRGFTPDALPAQVERLREDRDLRTAGLHAFAGSTWDGCDVLGGPVESDSARRRPGGDDGPVRGHVAEEGLAFGGSEWLGALHEHLVSAR